MIRLESTIPIVLAALVACNNAEQPTSADASIPATANDAKVKAGSSDRLINIMDACDPETFNAALGDGTCQRDGGMNFATFNALLAKHHQVGAWHFAPGKINAKVGQTLLAVNRGGEEHTFTEVEEFGGGIIPALNEASGNPVPAPECLALAPDDFIQPGDFDDDDVVEEPGTENYQCCIHPWMRATVTAREK
jgi:plastocyanin